ncbi:MAG TPA: molybdenum cofactor biosynthesis protein MoaE [Actinomycetota bacterium]|nr:molybdenum cofactor biosynthesis protein MoaE [Actinomycetota bacterium]
MRVRVRLFGALAERAGLPEVGLDLPPGATAADACHAALRPYPTAAGLAEHVSIAVNLEVVPGPHRLNEGDEVGLLPPVAGGADGPRILTGLRPGGPDPAEALAAVTAARAGGIVAFIGSVRTEDDWPVEALEYSAYDEMADRVLTEIAAEVAEKWPLEAVAIVHATGRLPVGAVTFVVACAAPHREEAFAACRHAVEEVKRRAPIWKREVGPHGARWVGL